ncbi:hypothetical protein [Nocardiopsis halophila]|uniref:hypothetical protein n=1 Tax=Nocardiopsis halophila TaxID=141692 RepID=UPI000344E532|nr:hypothetical protein [Nocardiopsis halophila]
MRASEEAPDEPRPAPRGGPGADGRVAAESAEDRKGPEGADGGPPLGRRVSEALSRGLRDRIVLIGGALAVVSLLLKAYVLRDAYFIEDDFLFVGGAGSGGLTVEYLTDLHKGHFMPGAKLLAYVQTALAPYNWGLTAGVMLAFQAGAAAGLFRLLWVLFGRRWGILPPLAVFLFAPLTVPVLAWWSAALNAVPFQLAIVLALLWTVRYLRGGEARFGWMAAGAVVLGMAFSVKALFLPPLLFAVAAAFVVQGRLPGVLWRTLDRDMPFWVGMALLSVGHGLIYLSLQDTAGGEGAGRPEGQTSLSMAQRLLGETFPAGAVGGPLEWGPITPSGGLLEPAAWVVAAAWAVLLLLVAASLLARRRAWRAWALLAGYLVVVDVLPTLLARGRYEAMVGYDPRYVADAALVFAIVLALAYLPTKEEAEADGSVYRRSPPPERTRQAAFAAATATALFVGVGGYSTYAFADTLSGDRVRWYMDTVRASMTGVPADAGIYPRPVPEDIVLPWNGDRRLSSNVLAPLAPDGVADRIRDPRPSDTAMVFNDAGYLVGARPSPEESAVFGPPEDEECIVTFGGQTMWEVSTFGGPTMVLGVQYTSETDTQLHAVIGDTWETTTLPAAPDGGAWYLPLQGAGGQLSLGTDEEALCMTWVTYGPMEPVTGGDPWGAQEEDGDEGSEDGEGDGSEESEESDGGSEEEDSGD